MHVIDENEMCLARWLFEMNLREHTSFKPQEGSRMGCALVERRDFEKPEQSCSCFVLCSSAGLAEGLEAALPVATYGLIVAIGACI